ncbi:hypothetical protein HUT18_03470 [Streptomyces sp. NA04227]|uniref:hypothetical protein n=1 Tax=Streptomyces sp. NA04227 TaxID=2742136 RepID=UPI00159249C1|nr:hypothetical protein [Streptomyces sp. NA04227]QKW05572.1 hypothetical protein HUT18_03470 [Streptomyces sp. NA04227]
MRTLTRGVVVAEYGIPMGQYKAARRAADELASQLREAFEKAGVPDYEAGRIAGRVSRTGCPYVDLGTLRVGSASKVLGALLPDTANEPQTDATEQPTLPAESFG